MPEQVQAYDALNHPTPLPGAALTAAAAGTSAAGTIIPVNAGAGAGSAVAVNAPHVPTDSGGRFQLTAAGTPAAGVVAQVFFTGAFGSAPIVNVEITDTTASPNLPVVASAEATTTGFTVCCSAALTAAHVYDVVYEVEEDV